MTGSPGDAQVLRNEVRRRPVSRGLLGVLFSLPPL